MKNKSVLNGIAVGIFAGITFGFIIWVQAATIKPGTVSNPTFGPTNDDVAVHLECVSGYYARDNTKTISPSTYGNTYAFSDVFSSTVYSGSQAQITCNSAKNWVMTDCAAYCPGSGDQDEEMKGQNSCYGTPVCSAGGSNDRIYARCCKYTL